MRFSIIINTHNQIRFIKDCINSCINQDFYDYEIIFSDNHSSDSTQKIITDLCKEDKKTKYIRFKSNIGYDKSVLESYKNSSGDATMPPPARASSEGEATQRSHPKGRKRPRRDEQAAAARESTACAAQALV